MEVTVKEEVQDAIVDFSNGFYNCNGRVKEAYCDDGSVKMEKLEQMQADNLEINKVYCCFSCDFKCSDKSTFLAHTNAYSCSISDSQLNTISNLGANEAVKAEPSYDNFSEFCSVKIEEPYLEELNRESVKIKIEEIVRNNGFEVNDELKCFHCSFECSEKSSLRDHVQTHVHVYLSSANESPLKNVSNRLSKRNKVSQKRNLNTAHVSEKPFHCTICEYKCSQKSSLQKHMFTHTGEKPFHCTVCEYKTTQKSILKTHMFTHTTEKPFKCTLCEFKTGRKLYLKQHVLTHTGEKPFPCWICEYKCAQKSSLNRHMWTHSIDKVLRCSLCKFECGQNSILNAHMLTHV